MVFDVLDFNDMIGHVYFEEPLCDPRPYDFDCNNAIDATDLVWVIDYLFFGGPAPTDPCLP